MATAEKEAIVAELRELISNSTVSIMTRYQGVTVAEVTDLRTRLRGQNVRFKVYKNNLAKIALDELGLGDAASYMEGPTAWAFCDDPVAPARLLKEFAKQVKVIGMQGGVLDGSPVGPERLDQLADLPSYEQLLAQVVGTIAMPLRNLVGTLNAVPRNFVSVVDQIRKQKEEQAA